MDGYDTKLKNIASLNAKGGGYDVVIICCSDAQQAKFWQTQCRSVQEPSVVVAVDEDWAGGAGNLLGTLYAWRKACTKHKELTGKDLAAALQAGASVALYHTAGKGTRLAPLPSSENNNKPGVKLPLKGCPSILDLVILQTSLYAASRKGRLSVYWGDQVFIPSVDAKYDAQYHADILCALGPMPNVEEWQARDLHKYGLIAARSDSSVAMMLEKVTHQKATEQLAGLSGVDRVGTSLGSFSVSSTLLGALGSAFAGELDKKQGKMDTDPHLWMPMTLTADDYSRLMIDKALFDDSQARAHHARVAGIVKAMEGAMGAFKGMYGAVNVGSDASWWDYGMLPLYRKNCLLFTEDTDEGRLARAFFGSMPLGFRDEFVLEAKTEVDAVSVVTNSCIKSGSVRGSVVANVTTEALESEGAVLVNVAAPRIKAGKGSVAYNLVSKEDITLAENEVRVGVFLDDKAKTYFTMRSNVAEIDGGKVFKEKVLDNKYSFQEVYDLNNNADVIACAERAREKREEIARSIRT